MSTTWNRAVLLCLQMPKHLIKLGPHTASTALTTKLSLFFQSSFRHWICFPDQMASFQMAQEMLSDNANSYHHDAPFKEIHYNQHPSILLTHRGRVTHICISKLTGIIGSDNGLAPGWRQAIIWTNAGILLNEPLGTNFQWNFNQNSNIFIEENTFENAVC